MKWLGPQFVRKAQQDRWPVLLSVCPNIDRMLSREHILSAAGYQMVSASTLEAASQMAHLYRFDLVLLDQDYACELEAGRLHDLCTSMVVHHSISEKDLLVQLGIALQQSSLALAVQ